MVEFRIFWNKYSCFSALDMPLISSKHPITMRMLSSSLIARRHSFRQQGVLTIRFAIFLRWAISARCTKHKTYKSTRVSLHAEQEIQGGCVEQNLQMFWYKQNYKDFTGEIYGLWERHSPTLCSQRQKGVLRSPQLRLGWAKMPEAINLCLKLNIR